jgi:hypothetical protein
MFGLSFSKDRKWLIGVNGKWYELRDYNDEITGYDKELHKLAPDIIHYGGNAYYATGKFAEKMGWQVMEINHHEYQ